MTELFLNSTPCPEAVDIPLLEATKIIARAQSQIYSAILTRISEKLLNVIWSTLILQEIEVEFFEKPPNPSFSVEMVLYGLLNSSLYINDPIGNSVPILTALLLVYHIFYRHRLPTHVEQVFHDYTTSWFFEKTYSDLWRGVGADILLVRFGGIIVDGFWITEGIWWLQIYIGNILWMDWGWAPFAVSTIFQTIRSSSVSFHNLVWRWLKMENFC